MQNLGLKPKKDKLFVPEQYISIFPGIHLFFLLSGLLFPGVAGLLFPVWCAAY